MSEKSRRQIQQWVDAGDSAALRQLAIAMVECRTVASAIRVVQAHRQQDSK